MGGGESPRLPAPIWSKDILEHFRVSFNKTIKELVDTYSVSQVWSDLSGGRVPAWRFPEHPAESTDKAVHH